VALPAPLGGAGGRRAVQLIATPHRPGLLGVAATNTARVSGRLLLTALGHPLLLAAVTALAVAVGSLGPARTGLGVGGLGLLGGLCRWRWPEMFDRLVTGRCGRRGGGGGCMDGAGSTR
jgi:hypothetical protein